MDNEELFALIAVERRRVADLSKASTFASIALDRPWGRPMTDMAPVSGTVGDNSLSERAQRHLWMHFTRLGAYGAHHEVPVIVRGEGAYVWDQRGKRYLDGLAGLFTGQIGHGRTELAEAAAKQASELAYFPLWTYAHPRAIELAERIAALTPGDLNRVFFTTGGSEAVESAWKLATPVLQAHRPSRPGPR